MSSEYGGPPPNQDSAGGFDKPPSGGQYGQPPGGGQYGGGQYGGYGPPPGYGGYGGPPQGPPPPNYLVWAILTTLFCCLPLGVVSIVFSAQVNGKWQSGDQAGAMESSRKAKQWAIWSAVVGAVLAVIYILIVIVAIAAGDNTTSDF